MDIITFLNKNAGAIQGVAACVTVALTGMLAFLTWKYVRLTGTIADAANRQVELAALQADIASNLAKTAQEQRTSEEQRIKDEKEKREEAVNFAKRRLEASIVQFLVQLASSGSMPEEEFLRTLPVVDDQKLESIRTAAIEAKEERMGELEGALSALQGIAALQKHVIATPAGQAAFTSSEQASYSSNLRNARDGLKRLTRFRPASERY